MSDKVEEALDVLGRYTLAGKVVQAAVVVNQEIRRQQAEIERLKAENHLLRNTTSVTELDARVRLDECKRLLRRACVIGWWRDERWFEEAKEAGGSDD